MSEELIKKSDAIKAIDRRICELQNSPSFKRKNAYIDLYGAKALIMELPSADRPQGEWMQNENGTFSCSECRSWIPKEQRLYARYCLYCGTPMKCAGDMRKSGMYIVTHPMYE